MIQSSAWMLIHTLFQQIFFLSASLSRHIHMTLMSSNLLPEAWLLLGLLWWNVMSTTLRSQLLLLPLQSQNQRWKDQTGDNSMPLPVLFPEVFSSTELLPIFHHQPTSFSYIIATNLTIKRTSIICFYLQHNHLDYFSLCCLLTLCKLFLTWYSRPLNSHHSQSSSWNSLILSQQIYQFWRWVPNPKKIILQVSSRWYFICYFPQSYGLIYRAGNKLPWGDMCSQFLIKNPKKLFQKSA